MFVRARPECFPICCRTNVCTHVPVSERAKLYPVNKIPNLPDLKRLGETELIRSISKFGCLRRIGLSAQIGAMLLFAVQTLPSQNLPDQRLGGAQSLSDQCSGPMAALIPECQAARSSGDLPSIRQLTPGTTALPQVNGVDSIIKEESPSTSSTAGIQASAPEPPSEFQRFAASSIGQILPIFGAALFEKVPTTYAPLDRVPVTAEYVIGPGDEILLRVWGQVGLDLRLQVDRAGSVYIPQVGNVNVSGIQFRQLSDYMRSQLGRVFRNFDLSVSMGQLRSIQIFVMGQARRPGTYTVSSLSTLVNALFASGGPSAQGSMRHVQLKRGSQVAADLDLYDLLLRGDKSGDARLMPEDVIYIPTVGPQIAASGSLKNPAIYELKDEKTIGELIQMSGGLSPTADRKRATIERIKEGVSREVLDIALGSDGLNAPIFDGDVFQVLAIAPRFENSVTLRGNVADPGRFSWRPGMRLRDIIPDKESLVTRDYWKKRNLLGNNPVVDLDLDNSLDKSEDLGSTNQEAATINDYLRKRDRLKKLSQKEAAEVEIALEAQRKPAETRIEPAAPDINWSYAVIERQNPRDLKADLIPFHLGKLVLEKDDSQNLELRSGDVITIFSQKDIRAPQLQQNRSVRLEGEFNAPGVYTVGPGETLGQIIQKAGGLTPQAYLFGSEFLRESTRRDQQKRLDQYIRDLEQEIEKTAPSKLGSAAGSEDSARLASEVQSQRQLVQQLRSIRASGRIVLSLEPGSNDISGIAGLALEDGDQFILPARPATVNILGAVYNPNSFVHSEKRQVMDYVLQAGGPTRNADEKRVYIVRADGSVLPKQHTSSFDKLRLNPGDSVVMPEQLFKTTFMMGLRSWSQVFSQFGLAAAAVNVLR
jgi:polysaccharide biosynthesis/export protein